MRYEPRKRKGVSSVTGAVLGLIIVAVFMVIGVYILSSIQGNMPEITDTQANQTATNIWSSVWNAYGMLPIVLIVLVAVAIIGVLLRGFGAGGGE